MNAVPAIVWFRSDLRLRDNPALRAAVAEGGAVIPIFILAPKEEGGWEPGAASRWWLHHSLASLDRSLRGLGSRLLLRCGASLQHLLEVAAATGSRLVFYNRRYEPAARERDRRVERGLVEAGLEARSFNASLLHEPWEIATVSGGPYQVFTPFSNACLAATGPPPPLPAPRGTIRAPRAWPASLPLDRLGLHPAASWTGGLGEAWQPGEEGALRRLRGFAGARVEDYPGARACPDRIGTSRLSPHLHFGEIGPRQILAALERPAAARSCRRSGARPAGRADARRQYARQLIWREFGHHLLHHFPHTPGQPLRRQFAGLGRHSGGDLFAAWRKGRTGYPIVDAGMRELRATGWMHNRARMVAASFLVKDLLIAWQEGAKWFWDTLVDADLANNTLGWQWTAGCGADAAPFFRIFNPVRQGMRFDPDGAYVRRWVPEIARLPTRWIHRPWEAPASELASAGVVPGRTYPRPLVDHEERRALALAAYHDAMRRGATKDRGREA